MENDGIDWVLVLSGGSIGGGIASLGVAIFMSVVKHREAHVVLGAAAIVLGLVLRA